MTPDISFFYLITNASVPVQAVMIILVIASVMSWTMIFKKRIWLSRAQARSPICLRNASGRLKS